MMKRKITYAGLLLVLLTGCGDSDKYDPTQYKASLAAHYLRPSQTTFTANSAKECSYTFDVKSVDTPWAFTDVMTWTTVYPMYGSASANVSFAIEENTSGDTERLGVFYLSSTQSDWDYSFPISVKQPAATPYATVSASTITLNGAASSQDVTVQSNCSWDISNNANWLQANITGEHSGIKFTASENTTNSSRSATVYVSFGGKNLASISVTQKAAGISAETATLEFENTAGEYSIKVTSEAAWTAKTSQTWIQVSPDSGKAGTETIKVTVTPNSTTSARTGYVYLYIGSSQVVQIAVTQKGLYVEFSASSLEMTDGVDEKTITVKSNTSWTISSYPSWVTVTPTSGEGTQNVTIKTADNPNTSKREGTIKATQAGVSLEASLTITQLGKTFDYGQSTIECSDKAQTLSVMISSNGSWTASSIDSWITVKPSSASGNGTLSIAVTENTADDARTGKVSLSIGNKTYEITVIQSGKYFTVKYEGNDMGSTGGKIAVEISSNDSWTVSAAGSPSWITLDKTSGSGNVSFNITVADNPSVNSRTATVTLATVHEKSVKIIISQAARYLTVDHQSILFFAKGGDSDDITISTDGKYSITKTGSWFSITEKGHGVFVATAQENTEKDAREGSVVIKLTDLKEGTYSITLSVVQTSYGGTFIIDGYGEDKNWDIGASSNVSLTVTGYSSDKNWDNSAYNIKVTISVTGYNSDSNWDSKTSSSGNMGTGGYSSDKNWDSSTSSQGNFSKRGYNSDTNWGN